MEFIKLPNEEIERLALEENFDLIGFAKVEELKEEYERYIAWLERGYAAEMKYMEKNLDLRKNLSLLLENCKSIITFGANYFNSRIKYSNDENYGKVSRYAVGIDYHLILWNKCKKICKKIKSKYPAFEYKYYVDTGPILEKVWGQKSGIGWIGKNTLLINPKLGSWFFIAIILTNAEFDYSTPMADRCGRCSRCVDACPTQALTKDRYLDSNKCISYYTIEYKDESFPENMNLNFQSWIFGCDICQEVCPFNLKFQRDGQMSDFFAENLNIQLDLNDIINDWNENFFKERFLKSPIKRSKLNGMKRNANYLIRQNKLLNKNE
jgi:epoxyqueuosine reductase